MKKRSAKKTLIILGSVLAVLLAAWGIWYFVENHDFSPVRKDHYDDTSVAQLSYTAQSGQVFEKAVSYGEIRYYVKYYGLSAEDALGRVETDWVPEIIASIYGVSPGLTLDNAVDAEIENYKAFTGEDHYEDVLAGLFMTPALHERFVYLKQLSLILEESLCEDPGSPILRDTAAADAFVRRHYGVSVDEMDDERKEEALNAFAVDVYQNLFADIQGEIRAEKSPLLGKIDSSVR